MICERAESVGGQVTVESEPGQGTLVVINIPTDGTTALQEQKN
jgi:signal transduction histidine kinase